MFHVHELEDSIINMTVHLKFIYRPLQCLSNSQQAICRNWEVDPKISVGMQRTVNRQNVFEKEKLVVVRLLNFKT